MTYGEQEPGLHEVQSVPSDVRGALLMMEYAMNTYPQFNHAGMPSNVLADLARQGKVHSVAEFESWLRHLESNVHFVAVLPDFFETGPEIGVLNIFNSSATPEYVAWVGVNGPEEAAEMLARIGITPEENLLRLQDAGFLQQTPMPHE